MKLNADEDYAVVDAVRLHVNHQDIFNFTCGQSYLTYNHHFIIGDTYLIWRHQNISYAATLSIVRMKRGVGSW